MIKMYRKARPSRRDRRSQALPGTEGLDAFDRRRAASVADEGGSTAAHLERMGQKERVSRANEEDEPLSRRRWIFVPFVLLLPALVAPASAQIGLTPLGLLTFGVDSGGANSILFEESSYWRAPAGVAIRF
jgi:hypothetical protein